MTSTSMDSKISEAAYLTELITFVVKIVKVLAEIINKSSSYLEDRHHQLISYRQIPLSLVTAIINNSNSSSICSHHSLEALCQGTPLSKNQLKPPYRYRKCKCCARYHLKLIYVSLIKKSLSTTKKTTNSLRLSNMESNLTVLLMTQNLSHCSLKQFLRPCNYT